MDAIEIGQTPSECKREVLPVPEYDRKQVHVLDADKKGFMLWQCDGKIGGPGNNWCALDIEINNGAVWPNQNGFKFVLAESEHQKQGYVSLYWVLLGTPLPAGTRPVSWNNVNGFISAETNTVVLFADGHVYNYMDRFVLNKHMFAFSPSKTYLNMTALKLPATKYFSCDGQPFLERIQEPDMPIQSKGGRVKVIYALFGAHFLVAAIMIVVIVVLSNTSNGIKANSAHTNGSHREGPKRVRKGRRSPSSRENQSLSAGSKSRSSKSGSAKLSSTKSGNKSSSNKSASTQTI